MIAYEAKQRSFIRRQHGLDIAASAVFEGLHHAPYQLMPRGWLSQRFIWRMHLRLRRIELKILRTITELNLIGSPPLNLGINNRDVVIHLC
jgi:hypothetical protein